MHTVNNVLAEVSGYVRKIWNRRSFQFLHTSGFVCLAGLHNGQMNSCATQNVLVTGEARVLPYRFRLLWSICAWTPQWYCWIFLVRYDITLSLGDFVYYLDGSCGAKQAFFYFFQPHLHSFVEQVMIWIDPYSSKEKGRKKKALPGISLLAAHITHVPHASCTFSCIRVAKRKMSHTLQQGKEQKQLQGKGVVAL